MSIDSGWDQMRLLGFAFLVVLLPDFLLILCNTVCDQ